MGLLLHENKKLSLHNQCSRWLEELLAAGVQIRIPEIIDYEVRRELLRLDKHTSLTRLATLRNLLGMVPLDSATMLRAAVLWADARKQGRVTADYKALDIDVILAAQTQLLSETGHKVIVATQNVRHLAWFVEAYTWSDINLI